RPLRAIDRLLVALPVDGADGKGALGRAGVGDAMRAHVQVRVDRIDGVAGKEVKRGRALALDALEADKVAAAGLIVGGGLQALLGWRLGLAVEREVDLLQLAVVILKEIEVEVVV